MNQPYLLLWLEGPLQSWGHDSRFGRRETLNFPTKSWVLGMVCPALGIGGPRHTYSPILLLSICRSTALPVVTRTGSWLPASLCCARRR
ncbi:type I-E CRISPR-associated protein Cas5/CasD [Aeromonas hydrophila]|uniref:Type I-E CRISPR-associated protein Cas5/CasD n=1 Tax=Aeromonas hydrophila TaxID=644 RepID=A0ABD7GAA2_AERHY|nr:type I-E CRISPR-associated protein Cas5/CasD [Aeromonas hydrophila]MCW4617567.1 type I-E CRISPR-associated protein Cas5/CasD [Aeromonas hydrophila]RCF51126.1 type I-E CRISPR-associated protein Cas5/CasD [Aeromonas hydrophila]HAT2417083.1 type I-E CRISPR-associated protein Cas5/CasD [Aeromonas hydrophila]HAT2575019.1 type I-E CRISPR-associated protein Cas5/CasD [Aeromonas hydrophila]HAT2579983.1 type I-E CRISPR-associated protein Cas5/CasD [Aeromonas hydrophila]